MDYKIYDNEMGFCNMSDWCRKNKVELNWAAEKKRDGWSLEEIKMGERIKDYAIRNWGIK